MFIAVYALPSQQRTRIVEHSGMELLLPAGQVAWKADHARMLRVLWWALLTLLAMPCCFVLRVSPGKLQQRNSARACRSQLQTAWPLQQCS